MKNIQIKYNIDDKILFKSKFSAEVHSGTIKKYLIESTGTGDNVCYYVTSKSIPGGFGYVDEKYILSLANNVTEFKYIHGDVANTIVSNVLDKISLKAEVVSITFDGNKTTLKYKTADNSKLNEVISECHQDDTFSEKKGIEACLYKAIIKQAETKLKRI